MINSLKKFIYQFSPEQQDPIEKALDVGTPRRANTKKQTVSGAIESHDSHDYMSLKSTFRDSGRMNAIIETLGRDFLTAMPDGAYISRLGQIAYLHRRQHEDLKEPRLNDYLINAKNHHQHNPDLWNEWDVSNLREMETIIRHHANIPSDLIEKRARLSYEGRHVHRDVLRNNDWDTAKTFLEGMIELLQRIADAKQLDNNNHPEARYQSLLREFIPDANIDVMSDLFDGYKREIDTLYPQIIGVQNTRNPAMKMDGIFRGKSQMRWFI
jgi:Zn-dependent M32 family carboxypeptidase